MPSEKQDAKLRSAPIAPGRDEGGMFDDIAPDHKNYYFNCGLRPPRLALCRTKPASETENLKPELKIGGD